MTALEEIKKALEGDMNTGLTAIDRLRFIVGGVPDFDPITVEDADWIIAALESLQLENEELKSDLSHESSHRQKLQNALAYWMPGVTEEIEISTNGRCGDDALLLVGSKGPFEDKCWGNEAIARAEAAESEVKRLKTDRLYIIGFNEGWEAAVGEPPENASALASTGGEHDAE